MANDLSGCKLTDLEFQSKMEDLYRRVDLKSLIELVKLEEIERNRSEIETSRQRCLKCGIRPKPS
jgi:hypothetical protein